MIDTWEKIIDPNFINAELLGPVGAEKVVTITDIEYAEAWDQKRSSKVQKQAVFFEECKPLVLNKTNAKTLKALFDPYGINPRSCVGRKVTLYVIETRVGGKTTTGIRIKEALEVKCEECGSIIKSTAQKTIAELIEISKRNCEGKTLCIKCMKKFKEEHENA